MYPPPNRNIQSARTPRPSSKAPFLRCFFRLRIKVFPSENTCFSYLLRSQSSFFSVVNCNFSRVFSELQICRIQLTARATPDSDSNLCPHHFLLNFFTCSKLKSIKSPSDLATGINLPTRNQ